MQCFTFYRCVSCLLCDSSPVSGAAKLCFITKKKKIDTASHPVENEPDFKQIINSVRTTTINQLLN